MKNHSKRFLIICILILVLTLFEVQEVNYQGRCDDMGYETNTAQKRIVWTCDNILNNKSSPAEGYPTGWIDKCCSIYECKIYPECFNNHLLE